MLIGGGGRSALMGAGARSIEATWRFRLDELSQIGTDTRVVARHPGRLEGLPYATLCIECAERIQGRM